MGGDFSSLEGGRCSDEGGCLVWGGLQGQVQSWDPLESMAVPSWATWDFWGPALLKQPQGCLCLCSCSVLRAGAAQGWGHGPGEKRARWGQGPCKHTSCCGEGGGGVCVRGGGCLYGEVTHGWGRCCPLAKESAWLNLSLSRAREGARPSLLLSLPLGKPGTVESSELAGH